MTKSPILLVLFLASLSTHASGILEINQTCALNSGCFAGDSAGFPVTIDGSAGVSYELTGSLDLTTTPDTIAIEINASNITLNLNGFEIRGPVACSGSGPTLDCGPTGSATGIRLNAGAEGGLIRNGTIRNMGGSGVASAAANHVILHQLRALNNAADGFRGGNTSIVTECIAVENGDDGFQFGVGSVIERSTAEGNGDNGIETDAQRGVVRNSTTRRNGGRGFELGHSSRFSDNTSDFNSEPDSCGGGVCTEKKRFYLTTSSFAADQVLGACIDGFHMADFSEIQDLGNLRYDNVLGEVDADHSGYGPPSSGGAVRTGLGVFTQFNCSNWTSTDFEDRGVYAAYGTIVDWDEPAQGASPWVTGTDDCALPRRVWCAEDR